MIYFFRKLSNGQIKIGTTERLSQRQKSLKGEHGELELLGVLHGGLADERALHDRFDEERTEGEWFAASDRLLAFIETEAFPWDGKDERGPSRNDVAVKIDAEVARTAKHAALYKKMCLAEYLSETIGPIALRHMEEGYAAMLASQAKTESPSP